MIGRPILDDSEEPRRKAFRIDLFPMAMKFQKGLRSEFLGDVTSPDAPNRKTQNRVAMLPVHLIKRFHREYGPNL
jgi:hypothetical protein